MTGGSDVNVLVSQQELPRTVGWIRRFNFYGQDTRGKEGREGDRSDAEPPEDFAKRCPRTRLSAASAPPGTPAPIVEEMALNLGLICQGFLFTPGRLLS